MNAAAVSPTADREIVITRLLNAPRELVFKAWSDAKHLDRWWGPNGFRNNTHSMDFRVGGTWHYTMHGPDGVDWPNLITYREIVAPERLAYDHGDDKNPKHFEVIVTFAEEGSRTRLEMRSLFPTAAARDYVIEKVRAIEGGNQTISRLEQYLTTL